MFGFRDVYLFTSGIWINFSFDWHLLLSILETETVKWS